MAHVPVPVIDNEGASSITDDNGRGRNEHIPSAFPHQKRPRIMFRWAANGGYAIFLVIIAVLPSTSVAPSFWVPDWFAHAVAYGIQAALLYWATLPSLGHRRSLVAGVVGAGSFGVVTESLQFFQPERAVELKDLAANIVGALLVCCVIAGACRFEPGRES
jgi:VanZ family protein